MVPNGGLCSSFIRYPSFTTVLMEGAGGMPWNREQKPLIKISHPLNKIQGGLAKKLHRSIEEVIWGLVAFYTFHYLLWAIGCCSRLWIWYYVDTGRIKLKPLFKLDCQEQADFVLNILTNTLFFWKIKMNKIWLASWKLWQHMSTTNWFSVEYSKNCAFFLENQNELNW